MFHRFSWVEEEMQGNKTKCYSEVRSSLSNYPDHRRSPTETSGDNTPGSPDFPYAAWPTTPRLRVFRPGGAQCREDVAAIPFVTKRNNQDRHASLPPWRMTRGRPEGRLSSRRRSHGRCRQLTCTNNDETPGRSGPGDILRGTDSGGNLSTSSWRDRRITCWEYARISQEF